MSLQQSKLSKEWQKYLAPFEEEDACHLKGVSKRVRPIRATANYWWVPLDRRVQHACKQAAVDNYLRVLNRSIYCS